MQSISIINDHLCPVCNYKIGLHTNSPFGHNPKAEMVVATGENAPECPRSYNSLIIEKLTEWWNDAVDERNAYMKSYADACKERDLNKEKLIYVVKELSVLASGLTPSGWMSSKAQEILYGIERIK